MKPDKARRWFRGTLAWSLALVVVPALVTEAAGRDPERVVLDDFEKSPAGWTFIAGWEFPGARGGLTLDQASAHDGKQSYRLDADFRGGGVYVGTWRDMAALEGRDIKELRLWVKAVDITELGIRINDSSDQCFQTSDLHLARTRGWQELVLKISDLIGGEHWGGAHDGKWHGPIKGFGLNIGKDHLAPGAKQGSLYIDDLVAVVGPVVDGHPTLRGALVDPPSCRPGFSTRLTYRWDAEPLGRDFTASVHFIGPRGSMAFQDDHDPPVPTAIWSGRLAYTHTVIVPTDAPDGVYGILLGLYDHRAARRGWDRQELRTSEGATAVGDPSAHDYQAGVLRVDRRAPLPKLAAPTLSLEGFALTFDEEFNDLSVSPSGPGTRWCTRTKETFGDARFVDQHDGFPFAIENGVLRIAAARRQGKWCGGILASVDPRGGGFSQKFGYFEMRAKFPRSLGMWPAFWLLGQPALTDRSRTNIEIDVVEHYGVSPNAVHSTMHLWYPDGKHTARGDTITSPGLSESFHNYGVMVDETHVTWYFDGVEIQKQPTPEAAKVPLYLLVNLAMGGGWPIDKAIDPSYMYVDHVRAYAKRR